MVVTNVHSEHARPLNKQSVFGTLPYGYRGQAIESKSMRLGRPRCQIAIDEVMGSVVRQVFAWHVGYWDDGTVEEQLSIDEIIRRLKANPSA